MATKKSKPPKKSEARAIVDRHEMGLTDQELKLVDALTTLGMKPSLACRFAGYEHMTTMQRALEKPHIAAAIREQREINAQRLNITRDKVYIGMMEAIDMARIMSDPTSMIRGWREVGLLAGLYDVDPAEKKNLSDVQKRAIERIKDMTEEELLMIAAKDVTHGVTIDQEKTTH